jgi:IS1 family transposase
MLAGEQWDFVALDPDSRLILSVFVGKRLQDNAEMLLEDVKSRLAGVPELISSDEWPGYPEAIKEVFGQEYTPPRTGKPGRPAGPRKEIPEGLNYATVHKRREKGRVVEVLTKVVMGAVAAVLALLGGKKISTSYLERHNGSDRHRNARKGRKTYRREQGHRDARGFDVLHHVQLQLLLGCANAAKEDRSQALSAQDASDGRRTDRPRLVTPRMACIPGLSTLVAHHQLIELMAKIEAHEKLLALPRQTDTQKEASQP